MTETLRFVRSFVWVVVVLIALVALGGIIGELIGGFPAGANIGDVVGLALWIVWLVRR